MVQPKRLDQFENTVLVIQSLTSSTLATGEKRTVKSIERNISRCFIKEKFHIMRREIESSMVSNHLLMI